MPSKGFILLAGINVLFLGAIASFFPIAQQSPPTNRDAILIQDFENRVGQYVKLRKRLEASLPRLRPTASPEKLAQHERLLSERIRSARRQARLGAIFTPAISAEFKRLIRVTMRAPDATRIRSSLRQAGSARLRVHSNETYPDSAPLASTPPTLLLNLPKLPPELDYRFVSRDLVLRDVKANLIVDLISGALP